MDFSNYTEDELEEILRFNKINSQLGSTYLYVLATIGIPANILTILTMLTFQSTTATFFVTVLATCDGCALIFKLFFQKIFENTISSVVCKADFIPVFFTMMANWTLVLIALERFILVCFPLKKEHLLTKRRSYIVVALMAIVLFVPLATLFILMREHLDEYSCYVPNEEFHWFWTQIYLKVIANSLAVYIPFLFIFIFTAGVVIKLRQPSRQRRRLMRGDSSQNEGSMAAASINDRHMSVAEKQERAITVMMMFAALYFLVFSLPSCIFYTLPEQSYDDYDFLAWERHILFSNIQYLLLDSTHALNFFLYVLTGKRFRSQLKKVLLCMPLRGYTEKRKNRQNLEATQMTSNTQDTHDGL